MAAKNKIVYICSNCGFESAKWAGKCPDCGEWNTMNEEIKAPAAPASKSGASARSVKTYALSEITADEEIRYQTGLTELDRVLGGGIVKGSLVLLSGDPGIGKSTLLLQMCQEMCKNARVLYVSGEESAEQVAMRQEDAHAVKFQRQHLRDSGGIVAVAGDVIKVRVLIREGEVLRIAQVVAQVDDRIRGFLFYGFAREAETPVRIRQNQ